MCISDEEYKSYPFPTSVLIAYVVPIVVAMCILAYPFYKMAYDKIWLTDDYGGKKFGFIICIIVCYIFVIASINITVEYCSWYIYRAKWTNILFYVLLAVDIVLLIFYFCLDRFILKDKFYFYKYFAYFLYITMPLFSMIYLKREQCSNCGLANTQKLINKEVQDLGTEKRYHQEGGYYKTNTSTHTVRLKDKDSYSYSDPVEVEIETEEYVPIDNVYDGEYQIYRHRYTYQCQICNYKTYKSYRTEERID